MKTVLTSQEEIAVKMVDRTQKYLGLHLPPALSNQEKHFPVIFIEGFYLPKKGESNTYFGGYPKWKIFRFDGSTDAVDASIKYIKELIHKYGKVWIREFQEKFPDPSDDIEARPGYQLRSCGCFPEWLAISLTYIYYGK